MRIAALAVFASISVLSLLSIWSPTTAIVSQIGWSWAATAAIVLDRIGILFASLVILALFLDHAHDPVRSTGELAWHMGRALTAGVFALLSGVIIASTLAALGWAKFESRVPTDDQADALLITYAWYMADAVPGMNVPEALHWLPAHEPKGWFSAVLIMCTKAAALLIPAHLIMRSLVSYNFQLVEKQPVDNSLPAHLSTQMKIGKLLVEIHRELDHQWRDHVAGTFDSQIYHSGYISSKILYIIDLSEQLDKTGDSTAASRARHAIGVLEQRWKLQEEQYYKATSELGQHIFAAVLQSRNRCLCAITEYGNCASIDVDELLSRPSSRSTDED